MTRPGLLDLFCGAGGAAMGYYRAGFDVVGVDIMPQPHYPFRFVQADALAYVAAHGHEYDAIHASPPCQAYSEATPMHYRAMLPALILASRSALLAAGKPFVIENVENARRHLRTPLLLCGTMFGLPIWRHRYFELGGFWLLSPATCRHHEWPITLHCGSHSRRLRGATSAAAARRAMAIDWMTRDELYEAIPPAYTEFIGAALLRHVEQEEASREQDGR